MPSPLPGRPRNGPEPVGRPLPRVGSGQTGSGLPSSLTRCPDLPATHSLPGPTPPALAGQPAASLGGSVPICKIGTVQLSPRVTLPPGIWGRGLLARVGGARGAAPPIPLRLACCQQRGRRGGVSGYPATPHQQHLCCLVGASKGPSLPLSPPHGLMVALLRGLGQGSLPQTGCRVQASQLCTRHHPSPWEKGPAGPT